MRRVLSSLALLCVAVCSLDTSNGAVPIGERDLGASTAVPDALLDRQAATAEQCLFDGVATEIDFEARNIVPPKREPRDMSPDDYPRVSLSRGHSGVVVLDVIVSAAGRVESAIVSCSSGIARLDHAAIGMVQEDFRYSPARLLGNPIAAQTRIRVNWALSEIPRDYPRLFQLNDVPTSAVGDPSLDIPPEYEAPAAPQVGEGSATPSPFGPGAVTDARAPIQETAETTQRPMYSSARRLEPARFSLEDFPTTARARGDHGTVLLNLLVDTDGRVAEAQILSSSGHSRLDHAAVGMVLDDWLYEPAREAGRPVESWVRVGIEWPRP